MIRLSRYLSYLLISLFLIISVRLNAQTQNDLNTNNYKNYQEQDRALNNTYAEILKIYKDDTLFIKKLKFSERAWLKFRDSYMESIFPQRDKSYYGSVYPMCYYSELSTITKERVEQLKQWLKGTEEGDSCAGSIKTKEELQEIIKNKKL